MSTEGPQEGNGSPPMPQEEPSAFEKMMEPLIIKMYDPNFMENCAIRGVQSYVVGGALGFAFGSFFTGIGPVYTPPGVPEPVGWKAQTIEGFKAMGRNGVSMAKGFALVGAIFASSECVIEKHRGKSDLWNAGISGCFTGGVLGVRGGVMATVLGCVGFSAFSVAIDYFLLDH